MLEDKNRALKRVIGEVVNLSERELTSVAEPTEWSKSEQALLDTLAMIID